MRIALDAMGGDYAPKNTIEGAASALKAQPEIEKLVLVGNTPAIETELHRIGFQDPRTAPPPTPPPTATPHSPPPPTPPKTPPPPSRPTPPPQQQPHPPHPPLH